MAGVAHKAKVRGPCARQVRWLPLRHRRRLTWASGGTVSGIPANTNPAEIINMSLGGGGACASTYQDAISGAISPVPRGGGRRQ
jgi:serine protease